MANRTRQPLDTGRQEFDPDAIEVPEVPADSLRESVLVVPDQIQIVDTSSTDVAGSTGTDPVVLEFRSSAAPNIEVAIPTDPDGETQVSGNLVIKGGSIYSDNYVAGASGWAIDHAGSAEFNDVLVRGTIEGSTIEPTLGTNLLSNGSFDANVTGWNDFLNAGHGWVYQLATGVGIITSDTFNRANQAPLSGNTDAGLGGSASAWNLSPSNAFSISGNTLIENTFGAGNHAYAYVDTGHNNHSVRLKWATIAGTNSRGLGFIVRRTDASNYYAAYLYRVDATHYSIKVDKVVAGVKTNIFNYTTFGVPVVGDTFGVELNGNIFSFYRNGNYVTGLVDNTFATGTGAGLLYDTGTGGGSVDEVLIRRRTENNPTNPIAGTGFMVVSSAAAGTATVRSDAFDVVEGETYEVGGYWTANDSSLLYGVYLQFFQADGTTAVDNFTNNWMVSYINQDSVAGPYSWESKPASAARCPAGATKARVYITIFSPLAVGNKLWVDELWVYHSSAIYGGQVQADRIVAGAPEITGKRVEMNSDGYILFDAAHAMTAVEGGIGVDVNNSGVSAQGELWLYSPAKATGDPQSSIKLRSKTSDGTTGLGRVVITAGDGDVTSTQSIELNGRIRNSYHKAVDRTAMTSTQSQAADNAWHTPGGNNVSVSFTKVRSDTVLIVTLTCSMYVDVNGMGVMTGVQIGGTDYDIARFFFNTGNVHGAFSGQRAIGSISPGTYNIIGRWFGNGFFNMKCDANDFWTVSVEETWQTP